jgi:hypothetical protein
MNTAGVYLFVCFNKSLNRWAFYVDSSKQLGNRYKDRIRAIRVYRNSTWEEISKSDRKTKNSLYTLLSSQVGETGGDSSQQCRQMTRLLPLAGSKWWNDFV